MVSVCEMSSMCVKGTSLASLTPLSLVPQMAAALAVWVDDFSYCAHGCQAVLGPSSA